jgi:hypothetical protein
MSQASTATRTEQGVSVRIHIQRETEVFWKILRRDGYVTPIGRIWTAACRLLFTGQLVRLSQMLTTPTYSSLASAHKPRCNLPHFSSSGLISFSKQSSINHLKRFRHTHSIARNRNILLTSRTRHAGTLVPSNCSYT